MKVRVCYTEDVDDFYRLAVSSHYGKKEKASRLELQQHFEMYGHSIDDDVVTDYIHRLENEALDT